jgi:hypothetical protein
VKNAFVRISDMHALHLSQHRATSPELGQVTFSLPHSNLPYRKVIRLSRHSFDLIVVHLRKDLSPSLP